MLHQKSKETFWGIPVSPLLTTPYIHRTSVSSPKNLCRQPLQEQLRIRSPQGGGIFMRLGAAKTGQFTGKSHISMESRWFPVFRFSDFPNETNLLRGLHAASGCFQVFVLEGPDFFIQCKVCTLLYPGMVWFRMES